MLNGISCLNIDKMKMKNMGRWFDLSALSPSFKIVVALAIFHKAEKAIDSIDVLNKRAREFSMQGRSSFKKILEVLSNPKLLLF